MAYAIIRSGGKQFPSRGARVRVPSSTSNPVTVELEACRHRRRRHQGGRARCRRREPVGHGRRSGRGTKKSSSSRKARSSQAPAGHRQDYTTLRSTHWIRQRSRLG